MAVTRNDVATRAGVSPAVVSYVMNAGSRPVAPATRARVLAAMEELGYRPDGLARSLRRGKTDTLGLIVPDTTNPFFAELARAVEDAANIEGYGVLVCNSADDSRREHGYVQSLAERRIDGLIVVSTGDADLSDLTDLSIPVVALDRAPDASPVSTIRTDNEGSAFDATSHLIEHGHRRIGFVGGTDSGVAGARSSGWARALDRAGLERGPSAVERYSFAGGAAAARVILSQPPDVRPTALFISADVQAVGALHAASKMAVRVPEDLAIVSMDGTDAARFASPSLTTVAQPIAEMARIAVNHLARSPQDPTHRTARSEIRIGSSCGCPVVSVSADIREADR